MTLVLGFVMMVLGGGACASALLGYVWDDRITLTVDERVASGVLALASSLAGVLLVVHALA